MQAGTSTRYLLDTNICIYIAKGRPLAVRARFDQHTLHDLVMSTITPRSYPSAPCVYSGRT